MPPNGMRARPITLESLVATICDDDDHDRDYVHDGSFQEFSEEETEFESSDDETSEPRTLADWPPYREMWELLRKSTSPVAPYAGFKWSDIPLFASSAETFVATTPTITPYNDDALVGSKVNVAHPAHGCTESTDSDSPPTA
jgi:hypothetical protein